MPRRSPDRFGGDSPDRGLYVVWFKLPAELRVEVGSLGEAAFAPDLYAYVGSAQRNRAARLRRHLRREKPRRWHIDYLLPPGDVVAVTVCDGAREQECSLAEAVIGATGARRAYPRFGAGDCRCRGHLLVLPPGDLWSFAAAVDRAAGGVTSPPSAV